MVFCDIGITDKMCIGFVIGLTTNQTSSGGEIHTYVGLCDADRHSLATKNTSYFNSVTQTNPL